MIVFAADVHKRSHTLAAVVAATAELLEDRNHPPHRRNPRRCHPETKAYLARKRAGGKTSREAIRWPFPLGHSLGPAVLGRIRPVGTRARASFASVMR